jgi:hypothetical protein
MFKKIIIFSVILFIPFSSFGESATTFPKEDAGISAYTKTDDINENNNITKITEAVAFFESLGSGMLIEGESTHVIGRIPVKIEVEGYSFNLNPYIYIDIEGWIVAYFRKEEPSSKIVQWTNYSPGNLSTNILEEAVDKITTELDLTYSSLSYYHFQYPEANRMTIVVDTVNSLDSPVNNFSVTIPGTIYESSYSLYYGKKLISSEYCPVNLIVDGNIVHKKENMSSGWAWCQGQEFTYDFYPTETFTTEKPHSVVFKDPAGKRIRMGAATTFLYSN